MSYFYDPLPINGIINRPKLCFKWQNPLFVIEYTLLNVLILELKIYCGPYKFYGRSKFGQYDEVKNRAPSFQILYILIMRSTYGHQDLRFCKTVITWLCSLLAMFLVIVLMSWHRKTASPLLQRLEKCTKMSWDTRRFPTEYGLRSTKCAVFTVFYNEI